jgi:phosphocarrier protein
VADNNHTLTKKVKVINELGLHARAAAKIATLAGDAQANVWITKGTQKVNAASVIDILTLACLQGTHIAISVDDPSDGEILERIAALVNRGFGE